MNHPSPASQVFLYSCSSWIDANGCREDKFDFSDSHQELGKGLLACSIPQSPPSSELSLHQVLMHPLFFMALITVCAGLGAK